MMMEKSLFPDVARFCYVKTDPKTSDLVNFHNLHPLEQSVAAHSVDARKAEFGDARWCAHEALKELGYQGQEPILRGERGVRSWPVCCMGSVSHTPGFRAAVVAPTSQVTSLGLDVEVAEPLPEGVLSMIARSGEIPQINRLRKAEISFADRLLFCAKEATYKAWFAMTHRWLGFEQAEVEIREDGTLISYLLVRPTPVPFICGRWMVRDGYIIVSTTVEAGLGHERLTY